MNYNCIYLQILSHYYLTALDKLTKHHHICHIGIKMILLFELIIWTNLINIIEMVLNGIVS